MAFKHANNSEESVRRLYTGIGVAKVIAVNPTKAEMEQIYGTTIQNEPVYASTTQYGGKQMRVSFVLSVNINEEKPMITTVTFFVNDTFMKGTTSGKYQVIDKYGRTAWATQEEIDANKIPQYSNGPARIDKSYRKAYSGEVQLEQFIRALLCLDDPEYWNSNTSSWVTRTGRELEMCDGILEDVKAIINGDISELKECVSLGKNNEVKVLFGVRNNNDGRQYLYSPICSFVTSQGWRRQSISSRANLTTALKTVATRRPNLMSLQSMSIRLSLQASLPRRQNRRYLRLTYLKICLRNFLSLSVNH